LKSGEIGERRVHRVVIATIPLSSQIAHLPSAPAFALSSVCYVRPLFVTYLLCHLIVIFGLYIQCRSEVAGVQLREPNRFCAPLPDIRNLADAGEADERSRITDAAVIPNRVT